MWSVIISCHVDFYDFSDAFFQVVVDLSVYITIFINIVCNRNKLTQLKEKVHVVRFSSSILCDRSGWMCLNLVRCMPKACLTENLGNVHTSNVFLKCFNFYLICFFTKRPLESSFTRSIFWLVGPLNVKTSTNVIRHLKGNYNLIDLTLSFYWNFAYCKTNVSLNEKCNKISRSSYWLPWQAR